jgi:predicted nucleic acid-binding protein
MIALDTNVLIYACDKADPARQATALELISNAMDGVIPWQVACEFIAASRKLERQGFEVVVNYLIAHARDLFPRDVRPLGLGLLGQILDGLANNLELAKCRILPHPIVEECPRPALVYVAMSSSASRMCSR